MKKRKFLLVSLLLVLLTTPAFGIEMIITHGDVSGWIDLDANTDYVQNHDWDHLNIYLDNFDPISANVDVYLGDYNVLAYEGNSGSIYDNYPDPYGRTYSINANVFVESETWNPQPGGGLLPYATGVTYHALEMYLTIDSEEYYLYAEVVESAPVPEPSTIVLMGLGLVGLAGLSRKKFRR